MGWVWGLRPPELRYKKEKRDKTIHIARKNVLSDQSSISFRVGHLHVQTINMTYQLVTIEIKIIYIYEQ